MSGHKSDSEKHFLFEFLYIVRGSKTLVSDGKEKSFANKAIFLSFKMLPLLHKIVLCCSLVLLIKESCELLFRNISASRLIYQHV